MKQKLNKTFISVNRCIIRWILYALVPSVIILSLFSYIFMELGMLDSRSIGTIALLMMLTLIIQSAIIGLILHGRFTAPLRKFLAELSDFTWDSLGSSSGETAADMTDYSEVAFEDALYYILLNAKGSIRKAQEYAQELRLSNEKLQQANEIIENSTIVVFEWAIGPGIPSKYVSRNISNFGYTEDDFYSGKVDYWDFVYHEDKERTQNTVWNARKAGARQYKHSYRVACKNGDIRWVEEWVLLERDAKGRPVAEKGVLRDITEQVEIAEKLKQSEARYRELFENASAAIYTFDLNGRFTSVNNACTLITGYSNQELLAMNVFDLLSQEVSSKIKRLNLGSVIKNNLDKTLELEITCKDSRRVILECRSSLIYKDDTPIEIQTVAQDVTFRKQAEEKIHHLSYHDKLTGLHNRAYFDEVLKSLDDALDYPFSIIIGDMNGLKMANDAFGHKEGDNLLISTARILERACRKNDTISRLGGDEFAIILPKTSLIEANKICERIKQLCKDSDYSPLRPSIALGCAVKLSAKQSLEEFTRAADDDMYRNKLNENKMINHSLISTLQAALEEKMFETREHADRLRSLSIKLGSAAGLSAGKLDELAMAADMHDIGKIALPGETLLKPDNLTDKEWDVVKKHSEIGYHIILASLKMASIAEYILAHHERWDGKGYPRNLRGEEIPMISRIISIVDAYDVMQHKRPYREAMSKQEALAELERCAGSQFDPNLVHVFLNIES